MKNARLLIGFICIFLLGCTTTVEESKILIVEEPVVEQPRPMYISRGQLPGILKEIKTLYVEELPSDVDGKYMKALHKALSFWEKRVDVIFRQVEGEKADVRIEWIKEFGGIKTGHAINEQFLEIGLGDSNCLGKWQAYTYEDVMLIITHELGHVLGFNDNAHLDSIMYHTAVTSYETDIDEKGLLPDGYTKAFPVCTRKDVATYQVEINSDQPINVALFPTLKDYEAKLEKRKYNSYSTCAKNEITDVTFTCTVPKSAVIGLSNPSTFRLGKHAQYSIKLKEI